MKIKITDTGNGLENLKELSRKIKAINEQGPASLVELLNPVFIAKCSAFNDVDELFKASGFTVETVEDFVAIPDDEWDKFISENTSYDSWESMQKDAGREYIKKRL